MSLKEAEVTLENEIYTWAHQTIDGNASIDHSSLFPAVHLSDKGLFIIVISLEKWSLIMPADNYIRNFLESHKNQRWIVIWEDLWIKRKEIIKSRLMAFCRISERIHGRTCRIGSMTADTAKQFLEEHHLMGYTPAKYQYMLSYETEIMAVATFGRSVPVHRNNTKVESHELIRFCHRKGHHVSGGLSKLITHFRRKVNPDDIFTSVDREWSAGEGYANIGFKKISSTPPLCFYIDQDLVRHKKEKKGLRICNAGNIRMAITYK